MKVGKLRALEKLKKKSGLKNLKEKNSRVNLGFAKKLFRLNPNLHFLIKKTSVIIMHN